MDSSILVIVILAVAVMFIATFALAQYEKRENKKDRAPKQEDNTVPEAPAPAEPEKTPEKPQNSDIKRMILPLAVCFLGAGAVNGALTGLGYTLGGLGAMLLYLCAGLIAYIWITKK